MTELSSTQNPRVKQLRQLLAPQGRRAHGLFLAEGQHLVQEALRHGKAQSVLVSSAHLHQVQPLMQQHQGVQWVSVSQRVLEALSDTKTPQPLLAVCPLPGNVPLLGLGKQLLAMNRLQDPGNVGTILRSLDAAAFDGAILDTGCADPFSPKALRASMGAVFRLRLHLCQSLPKALLQLPGHSKVAGDLNGQPYYQHPPFGKNVCLLIGNEGQGLDADVLALADHRLKLPIPGGAESLNAAVAASLMIYDVMLRAQDA